MSMGNLESAIVAGIAVAVLSWISMYFLNVTGQETAIALSPNQFLGNASLGVIASGFIAGFLAQYALRYSKVS
jgi:hypothetical protein